MIWFLFFRFYDLSKAIQYIKLPIKYTDLDDGIDKFRLEQWPIIDPHSIADFLFGTAGLTIPAASLREFWLHNAQYGEAWAQNVPLDTVPLGIYGDSARVNTKFGSTNLIGIYFSCPLWKPQSVRASRWLVTVIEDDKTWHHYTLQCILRRVTWSLNCLMDGQHPACGPYGEQLPPKLAALAGKPFQFKWKLVEIRGDWQWHKRTFRFHQCSWNGKKVCYWCGAMSQSDDPGDLYWNFETSTWDGHNFNLEQFLAERIPPTGVCFLSWQFCFLLHFGPERFFSASADHWLNFRCSYEQGPFIGLRDFHPSMIRWCLMHVVHLGLLFVCNGSGMMLVIFWQAFPVWVILVWCLPWVYQLCTLCVVA